MLIAICDDEQEEREAIETALVRAADVLSAELETAVYASGEALLAAVDSGVRPAMALLDVYMEGMGGMETARRLRQALPGLPLAFLTASRDFAIDAFELGALHYIIKPVTEEKVSSLLLRLFAQRERAARCLKLGQGREARRFPLEQLQYLTSRDRGVELHLQNQTCREWLACPFWQAAEQLAGERDFLKISRSCIVNMNGILYLGRAGCQMKSGENLLVSRRLRQEVQNRYHDFLFRKMSRTREDAQ